MWPRIHPFIENLMEGHILEGIGSVDLLACHFRRGSCQNYRQESKNKVSSSYKTLLSSKIFPKHDLVRSFRERPAAVHLSGPYMKVRTAKGTNQKAPFHGGPVQPYDNIQI